MKQTAVEWLLNQLENQVSDDGKQTMSLKVTGFLRERAKEMEKQKMIEMHDKGFDSVVQLNDDYAIGFAAWCLTIRFEPIENVSVKKLLEIYKKEKGL